MIHRDIKPENILLHDGQALVADFGIALAVSSAGGTRMTETGMSLGTPHYMSPEQAMGERTLDARTDVYALGCVLYEMLTGEPPFTGPTAQAIVAKVMASEPEPVTTLRKMVSPNVAEAIHVALQKIPADRWGNAAEFSAALGGTAKTRTTTFTIPSVAAGPWRAVALGAVVVTLAATVAAVVLATRREAPRHVVRAALSLPSDQALVFVGSPKVALAPDGTQLVYAGLADGAQMLLLRSLNRLVAEPLPGTQGGSDPFFSPDGQWVGFFSGGKLRKVSVHGSPPLTVADGVSTPRGGTWSDDGYIYFTPNTAGGVVRVRQDGGPVETVTVPTPGTGYTSHRWPAALPDGRGVLFTAYTGALGDAAIGVAGPGDTTSHTLIERALMPRYSRTGHLVCVNTQGALLAVRFDLTTLDTAGPVITLFEGVSVDATTAGADLALADDGTLAYVSGGALNSLFRVTRDGTESLLEDSLPPIESIRTSPGGRRLAMGIEEASGMSVFVYDLARRLRTRMTFEGTARYSTWHPSGDRLVFGLRTDSTDGLDLFEVASDGSGGVTPLRCGSVRSVRG